MADPPPVGGQTGATSDPARSPLEFRLSASRARSSSDESISVWGRERKRSTPSNREPSTLADAVRQSMVSRSMGGSESGPLPTSPGHIALCTAGCALVDTLIRFLELTEAPLAPPLPCGRGSVTQHGLYRAAHASERCFRTFATGR